MANFVELQEVPDWRSEKAIAFDLDAKALVGAAVRIRERIFLPISQTREQGGKRYVSQWILDRKAEELVEKGYSATGAASAIACLLGDGALEESSPSESSVDFSGIRDFFAAAAHHLATPKVAFEVNGKRLRLNRSGKRARKPGIVYATNGGAWGSPDREFHGSIGLDGQFRPTRSCPQEVLDFLAKFDSNPEQVAVDSGRESGNCCFCSKELTQERSRSVGYGPTCAGNYGLPW